MVTIRPTQASVDAAARYAAAHGYAAGIAVIDMQSGSTYASDGVALYSTESVSKLFIAARLRVDGPWTPDVAALAHTMIAQSDDDAANALYEQVGGDDVMNWVMSHYALPDLGEGPARPNWWGLFHVRPRALAQLLVDLRRDGQVWPWLGAAMQATTRIAGDGFDQSFGIRQVDAGAPVKQGWAYDYSLPSSPAALNTTGFVADGRYAVVVMVRGSHGSYPQGIATMTTAVTSLALGTAPRS
jgi:hypothetical protein